MPSPQRSLGHSLFKQKIQPKVFVFFCVILFFLCCFLFYQNFQIRTPWCNAHMYEQPVKIESKKDRRGALRTR